MPKKIQYKMIIIHRLILTEGASYPQEKIYTSRSKMIKEYNDFIKNLTKKDLCHYNSIFIYENRDNKGFKIIKGKVIAHDNY